MPAILEFANLGFAHPSRPIFEGLNLSLREGESVALLGPNGSGKTTLLRLACGLLRPSAGRVLVDGRQLGDWPRRQLASTVALVPQHLEVPFAFRVEEIVAQGRVPHLGFFGRLERRDHAAIEEALEAVDIARLRHRTFSELSGGERQRVKIAIGLAQQARLMLLDEPTQHLDLGRQIELMALLRELSARGITILAALHDLALARDSCSQAILLSSKDAPAFGPIEQMLRPARLERAFSVDRLALDRYLTAPAEAGIESSAEAHERRLRHPGEEIAPRRKRHGRRIWRDRD